MGINCKNLRVRPGEGHNVSQGLEEAGILLGMSVTKAIMGIIASVAPVLLISSSAAAASIPAYVGNDISYPQCGKTLPTKQAFGIVGVNGGIATTTNGCLTTQLKWAARSTGVTDQPK